MAKQPNQPQSGVVPVIDFFKTVRQELERIGAGRVLDPIRTLSKSMKELGEDLDAGAKSVAKTMKPLTSAFQGAAKASEVLAKGVEAFLKPFTKLGDSLEKFGANIGKVIGTVVGAPLAPVTGALSGVSKAWENATRPIKDFRNALDGALAPVRAAREAFGTLTAPVRVLAALPGQVAGAVAGIGQKAAGMLGGPTAALQNFFGRVQSTIGSLVEKANPGAVLRFNLALDDLYATLGQMLTPVLDQFTLIARTLGSALNGMTGEGKQLIAGLAAGAIGMAVFAAAAAAVQAALTGGIGPLLGAVAGALGGVALAGGQLQAAFKPVAEIIGGAFERLGEVFAKFAGSDAISKLAVALAEMVGMAADFSASLLDGLMPAFSVAADLLRALAPAFVKLSLAFQGFQVTGVMLLAKGLELAAPALMIFAEGVNAVATMAYSGLRMLAGLFGFNLPDLNAPARRSESKRNDGMAAKSTSTTDVQSVLRSARESSFKAGLGAQGPDPASRTAGAVEGMKASVGNIATALQKLTPQEVAKALADIMRNAAGERARAGVRAAGDYAAGQAKEVRQAATLVNPLAGVILGQLEGAISRLRR